jgi:glycosyltransferase involved in cell wall biosynthesis
MDSTLFPVVPSQKVVPVEITAIIPTLGRKSLSETKASLAAQTLQPAIIVKEDDRDTLVKLKEGVNEATTEFIAIIDDDAKYPPGWLEALSSCMNEKVGFVGGPCLPLFDDSSNDAERCIGEVTASWFGTSNMSYRTKAKGKVRDADETNLVGNGLYRRKVLQFILNEEYRKIPISAYETYLFIRIKQCGYRTLFNPKAFFYHKQRTNIFSFSKQIFRSGTGRMGFFKRFPNELWTKFYMLWPSVLLIYTILLFALEWNGIAINSIPLISYIAALLFVSYGLNKHKSKTMAFYYLAMHLSYGVGMLVGLFRSQERWT